MDENQYVKLMKMWSDLFENYDYPNKFSQENKEQLTKNLFVILKEPKLKNSHFIRKNFNNAYQFGARISALFSALIRGEELEFILNKYGVFKSLNNQKVQKMIDEIYNIYEIKIESKATIFRKIKYDFIVPPQTYERIINEYRLLSNKNHDESDESNSTWNDFVNWWANFNEHESNKDFETGLYMMMCYHNEVLNGGYDQFFDNKQMWDFKHVSYLFSKILPKLEYQNFLKAYDNYKNDIDNENMNKYYQENLMQRELEKYAKRITLNGDLYQN